MSSTRKTVGLAEISALTKAVGTILERTCRQRALGGVLGGV